MRRTLLVVLGLAFCLLAPMNRVRASCSSDCSSSQLSSCTDNGNICGSDSSCAGQCCCDTYICSDNSACEANCGCD